MPRHAAHARRRGGTGAGVGGGPESLVGFEYLALREVAGRATHPILRFRARAMPPVAAVRRFREEDGSRWKAIVLLARSGAPTTSTPLSSALRHSGTRQSGDHLHPEAARSCTSATQHGRARNAPLLAGRLAWEPGVMPGALADQRPLVDHVPDLVVKLT